MIDLIFMIAFIAASADLPEYPVIAKILIRGIGLGVFFVGLKHYYASGKDA